MQLIDQFDREFESAFTIQQRRVSRLDKLDEYKRRTIDANEALEKVFVLAKQVFADPSAIKSAILAMSQNAEAATAYITAPPEGNFYFLELRNTPQKFGKLISEDTRDLDLQAHIMNAAKMLATALDVWLRKEAYIQPRKSTGEVELSTDLEQTARKYADRIKKIERVHNKFSLRIKDSRPTPPARQAWEKAGKTAGTLLDTALSSLIEPPPTSGTPLNLNVLMEKINVARTFASRGSI